MSRDISALLSRNSDEWATPQILADDLGKTHNIAVDVACRSINAKFPIALAIDKGIDGLKFAWHEIPAIIDGAASFCNPPHSTIEQWIQKSIDESDYGVRSVMLIPASTGTDHWHDLVLPNAVEIQERRRGLGSNSFPAREWSKPDLVDQDSPANAGVRWERAVFRLEFPERNTTVDSTH